jgi:hypothetical protein
MSITAYFTSLDRFQISLDDRGILTSIKEKMMAAGAQMRESEMFTEDQMVAWDNKPTVNQTWDNLLIYFTEKGLRGASIQQPQPSNHVSRKRRWRHKNRHQRKKEERQRR